MGVVRERLDLLRPLRFFWLNCRLDLVFLAGSWHGFRSAQRILTGATADRLRGSVESAEYKHLLSVGLATLDGKPP